MLGNPETISQTIIQTSPLASWFVLRSKPQKEESLSHQLQARGLQVFCPSLRIKPANPRSRTVRPFFPGYLFVRVNMQQVGFSELQWIPFSLGLLTFDGVPVQVSEAVIKGIQFHLEKIASAGGELLYQLKQGDLVEIQNGPFTGCQAIFDMHLPGRDRVRILLKLLQGRAAKMEIPANLLEPRQRH